MLAVKAVKQNHAPSGKVLTLFQTFRSMVNGCIRIGLENDVSTMKSLSLRSYFHLKQYKSPSYYQLCAISRAAGILSARKASIRRGYPAGDPYSLKPQLISCYGFKIGNGLFLVPLGHGKFYGIPLTTHTLATISQPGVRVRSFTLTPYSLSLTISKEVQEIECTTVIGVDRNLRNLTAGNNQLTAQYDLSETVRIAKTTRRIVSSFKRNDVRIRRRIAGKYGVSKAERNKRLLHVVTKQLVDSAVQHRATIVLERITGIRRMYRRGNGQSRRYRARMNAWSFAEAQRQIEYKARWIGLPVIRLSRGKTRGTSMLCPRCGERLQSDKRLKRKLWCEKCREVTDRDAVAL